MAEKIMMRALSPTMESGVIAQWLKHEGEHVSSGEVLCQVETDKATMDYQSEASGTLLKIVASQGAQTNVGDLMAVVGDPGEDVASFLSELPLGGSASAPAEKPAEKARDAVAPAKRPVRKEVKSSPLARRLAEKSGIDLSVITGTGPAGRVIKRDVERVILRTKKATKTTAPSPASGAVPEVKDELIPVSTKRRIIAQRLSESMYSAPHYYLKVAVNMDEIIRARATLNAVRADKISMAAFLMKIAAEALKQHPMVNASWRGDTIRKFGRADIGLAVAMPDGVISPVVRDCGHKGIIAIDREVTAMIDKARAKRLLPEELTGATFTIINLGSFGIEEFTAIINPPGSATLAVGEVQRRFVPGPNNEPVLQSMLSLVLSCDHRVIDGAVGATFLKTLKAMLERPIAALY